MKTINRVTVDGEIFLIRVCGELVDATELEWAYTVAEGIAYRAQVAHKHLSRQLEGPGLDETGTCAKMGFPEEAYRKLRGMLPGDDESTKDNASRF